MNLKTPNYPALAAISYAIFSAFGLATWHALLFVAVPAGEGVMSTLHGLFAYAPGAPLLKFHAASTLLAACFALLLWLRPLTTPRGKLQASFAATLFAVASWVVFKSDTALLPTLAAFALAMSYARSKRQGEQ